MLTRLLALFLAVLLVVIGALSALFVVTTHNRRLNERLEALTADARDIAYMAAQTQSDAIDLLLGSSNTGLRMLTHMAEEVHEEYGAYILVVDRSGRAFDNLEAAYEEDPEFVASLSGAALTEALTDVLGGREIAVRTAYNGEERFTVGVPFVRNGLVLGAVLIQTKAQVIEGSLRDITVQIVLVSLAALLLATALTWLFTRSVLKPLREVTGAATRMADGDFTARVEAPGTLRETGELARVFNGMADRLGETEQSRREFVANVSHELRSPITSIRGFAEGMEDGTIPPEEHPKYLGIVVDESRRLSKLIDDLLALSRLERGDAELNQTAFDICEMLRRAVIRRMTDLDARKIEVICDFEKESTAVRADADRIEQVIVNLLDNAIKFTPDGGHITLKVRTEKKLCLVTVADDGIGILPEDRPHVFDRFFTADRAHSAGKGTGLGLSICQRILQMHHQQLRLDDVQDGASFTFTLEKA